MSTASQANLVKSPWATNRCPTAKHPSQLLIGQRPIYYEAQPQHVSAHSASLFPAPTRWSA